MKWFMCINKNSRDHLDMAKIAVLSALKNTSLEPHLVYAGECDEYVEWMLSKRARVHYRTLSYLDELKKCSAERLSIGSGAYLRTELACFTKQLGFDDKYALYTDCDVMFLKDPPKDIKPEYFACGPEFDKLDYSYCNTGVMYMNLHSLYYTYDDFRKLIIERMGVERSYDQVMFNNFYRGKWERLPVELNWKPYWGYSDDIVVLHWHGVKPFQIKQMRAMPDPERFGAMHDMWASDKKSYDRYMNIWEELACFV